MDPAAGPRLAQELGDLINDGFRKVLGLPGGWLPGPVGIGDIGPRTHLRLR